MNDIVEVITIELEDLIKILDNIDIKSSMILSSAKDLNGVPLNILDLRIVIINLIKKFNHIDSVTLDDDAILSFRGILNKIQYLKNEIAPRLKSGRLNFNIETFLNTLQWIDIAINPYSSAWEAINEDLLPKELKKQLQKTKRDLSNIISNKQELERKIKDIYSATDFVDKVADKLGDINQLEEEIERYQRDSKIKSDEISQSYNNIINQKSEIENIINRANEAYRIATTAGLAGSFEKRKESLKVSMALWTIGLVAALGIGAWIGYYRFEAVNEALKQKMSTNYIWILIFLSVLSFGAPIWFAWLSTKQIGQRFKLSEDYAFKASVAKAYEGYRKEAVNISQEMEARLFASALTRLDELPLRFMDKETHGSPWQEFLNNPSFIKMFKEKPEVLEKILDLAKGKDS